jgi:CelD/BcsL family acetyltransferase involved in cellulose biosynthesis
MEYTLHTSFSESLKIAWNTLLEESITHVPFLRYEYLFTWWQTRGGGEWPQAELAIITASENGRLMGIAPLFQADHTGQRALLLLGSIEISDYLDVIVRPQDLKPFLAGLVPFLKNNLPGWQILDWYNLLDTSPTPTALKEIGASLSMQYQQEPLQHSPFIPLPGDWEIYLNSIDKKQRHEIRRKMRRAEENETPVRWYIVKDQDQIEDEISAFLALMEQDVEKAAFLTSAMRQTMRSVMRCAFDEGCLQLAFLTIGEEKAAAYLNFDYLNRLWIYNSGFDRRFMEFSPGWVLLGNLLQWANENHRSEFDFMRGDEEYKYRFGAQDRYILRCTLSQLKTIE